MPDLRMPQKRQLNDIHPVCAKIENLLLSGGNTQQSAENFSSYGDDNCDDLIDPTPSYGEFSDDLMRQ